MSDLTELPGTPTTIPVRPDGEPVMSFAQERLWFMDAYAPGTTAYTIPEAWRLRGAAVDPDALTAALNRVAERHEPLRTRFPATVDGRAVMVVDDAGAIPLTTAEAVDDDAVGVLVDAFMAEPFDLATGPVARALLITVGPEEQVFALAVHHIAADGWSTELLLGEVLTCLAGLPLPELPVRYGDFAAWQRAQSDSGQDVAYWGEQLAGVAPLELPTDRQRPPLPTYAGAAHEFSVAPDVLDALLRLGRRYRATPYMVLLAAFAVLLGRRAGQDDITIGSPTAGRPVPELDDLVGCFVNMVTMRVDASGDPTFVELLQRVRSTAAHAFAHQELPFERLVTELNVPREVSRSPLFQVVFSLQSYESDLPSHPSFTVTADVPMSYRVTRFDLELHTAGDGTFLFVYNTALFTADSVAAMSAHLRVLLEGIAADPDAAISSYELLTAEEREQRARWNDTGADLGPDLCLHEPVEAQAGRTPDHPAVIYPGGQLSHAEVDRRAGHLAARLTAAGVRRGDLVAVAMRRGWEQVVAVLAVNKAGAAYLPVDADLPDSRRGELIARGDCTVVLTQPALAARLTWPDGLTVLPVTGEAASLSGVSEEPGGGSVALSGVREEASAAVLLGSAEPDDLAYVIFTSGSTGTPKGVMIEHRAALNTVRDINERFAVGPDDRVLALSALSFDLSVYDVYGTLAAGAALVMGQPAEDKDPAAWARIVTEQRITVWNSVPALMELLVEHAEQEGTDISSLRLVMMSGDWIPPTLPDRIRALAPHAEIISLGGATEGSIWSISYPIERVSPEWSSIPYGRPLTNQRFHVLDRGLCDVPVGVPGELCIGGTGVATGYWKDPERTAAAFVTHPRTGERLYRTGDLGRYRSDGVIEFLGRADAQVKVRGYRIELGEIEAHLARHPAVAECVVTVHGSGNAAQLVAYVIAESMTGTETATGTGTEARTSTAAPLDPRPGPGPDPALLRSHLAAALPAYMVPSSFVTLARLPLTANGKVDRGRLPAPEPTGEAVAHRTPPRSDRERSIHAVWADVLDREDFGVNDDFFAVGGHSLLAIKLVERLRRVSGGTAIAVMDLFTHPTVRQLAALLDGNSTTAPRGLLHQLTPEPQDQPQLTYVAVPFGGGSAMVYKPLADSLSETHALWSVAIPGHDAGGDEQRAPLEDIAARCVREIQEKVTGPVALYGHCGVGSALVVEIARKLEAAGRVPEAVYIGAIFPFARPDRGVLGALGRFTNPDALRSDRSFGNGLTAVGLELGDVDATQARRVVRNTRRDTEAAEEYFTRLFASPVERLRAPVISVAGERDPASDYYQERFREWHFLSETTAVVSLDEAGHFFQKHRAAELAEIVTTTHPAIASGAPAGGEGWRLLDVSHAGSPDVPGEPQRAVRRFLSVAAGHLFSAGASALTAFAMLVWIYVTTGSLGQLALSAAAVVTPGLLAAPLAGPVADRWGRRTLLIASDVGATAAQLALGALVWSGNVQAWHLYPLFAALSVTFTFRRSAFGASVPHLVPKRYLGHVSGLVQISGAAGVLLVPVASVALSAAVGLEGVLVLGVASCAAAFAVTLPVRFPGAEAGPAEPVVAEVAAGLRYAWGQPWFRRLLVFSAVSQVLLTPLFLLVAPLVLEDGGLGDAGWVLLVAALGGVLGGAVITVWGGPARRRMRGVLLGTLCLAGFSLLTGSTANLVTVGLGLFGLALTLTVLHGIHAAIVEVKVPQRFHGRVAALHTVIAWAAPPAGLALAAVSAWALSGPLLSPGGTFTPAVEAVTAAGPGRTVALLYALSAAALAFLALGALCAGLPRLVDDGPDATPDDVIGLHALGRAPLNLAVDARPAGRGSSALSGHNES
ncbi:non-ribosomal peptide synthetase/MFS transporter [Streptomyces cadmiisoli]|uniref:Non-ribosomal peptide synthetase n=1 Tax=Streptomyces cadmiisoli TaxID=2184053 RepID=A0A2Z4IRT4_9ACTN|nr:non-ribosomal peptide synthetase/MFS transporter [Streptomyces cadmiisoli]AWW35484.1 non-ribosomal peptide synthetase [Streptomyces cadmiisoli]